MKIKEFIFDTISYLGYAKIQCQSELDAYNLGHRGSYNCFVDNYVLTSRIHKVNNLIMKYKKIYKILGGK